MRAEDVKPGMWVRRNGEAEEANVAWDLREPKRVEQLRGACVAFVEDGIEDCSVYWLEPCAPPEAKPTSHWHKPVDQPIARDPAPVDHSSRPRMVRDRSGAMVQDGWLYTVAHAGGITELGHEWMVHPS